MSLTQTIVDSLASLGSWASSYISVPEDSRIGAETHVPTESTPERMKNYTPGYYSSQAERDTRFQYLQEILEDPDDFHTREEADEYFYLSHNRLQAMAPTPEWCELTEEPLPEKRELSEEEAKEVAEWYRRERKLTMLRNILSSGNGRWDNLPKELRFDNTRENRLHRHVKKLESTPGPKLTMRENVMLHKLSAHGWTLPTRYNVPTREWTDKELDTITFGEDSNDRESLGRTLREGGSSRGWLASLWSYFE